MMAVAPTATGALSSGLLVAAEANKTVISLAAPRIPQIRGASLSLCLSPAFFLRSSPLPGGRGGRPWLYVIDQCAAPGLGESFAELAARAQRRHCIACMLCGRLVSSRPSASVCVQDLSRRNLSPPRPLLLSRTCIQYILPHAQKQMESFQSNKLKI